MVAAEAGRGADRPPGAFRDRRARDAAADAGGHRHRCGAHIPSPVGPVRVRIFRHRDGGTQPALLYMHGGGWMQGSPETHWDITARIASWSRQTVISIDYAKAPEHPFPAAVEQCAAVVDWTFAEAGALAVDPACIAVGGDSAGGNLAAAMTIKFREFTPRASGAALDLPLCRVHAVAAVVPRKRRRADHQGCQHASDQRAVLPQPQGPYPSACRADDGVGSFRFTAGFRGCGRARSATRRRHRLRREVEIGWRAGCPRLRRGADPRLPSFDGVLRCSSRKAQSDEPMAGSTE